MPATSTTQSFTEEKQKNVEKFQSCQDEWGGEGVWVKKQPLLKRFKMT